MVSPSLSDSVVTKLKFVELCHTRLSSSTRRAQYQSTEENEVWCLRKGYLISCGSLYGSHLSLDS